MTQPSTQLTPCKHCTTLCQGDFCCTGCENAYHLLEGMNLTEYYARREIKETDRALIPEEMIDVDFTPYTQNNEEEQTATLHLMVEGVHCAACIWLIERVLSETKGVTVGRMNMSLRRLKVSWKTNETTARQVLTPLTSLGYRLMPYNPSCLENADKKEERSILLAMAVSGFASANVMLLSISLWAGADSEYSTRALFEWVSALITLPAVAFAGQTFFRSAWQSLKNKRMNMDVPISLAIILACILSVYETIYQNGNSYYDSAITLVFFLLIGRYLDKRSKNIARNSAWQMMTLKISSARVIDTQGKIKTIPVEHLEKGQTLLVSKGEVFTADGYITKGESLVDNQMMTGEALPQKITQGTSVYAGTTNLENPVEVYITAKGEKTTLAQIGERMEEACSAKNRYTRLADRATRLYAPVVHTLSLLTFIFWAFYTGDIHQAITNAIAVLIITCPCALALAIPSVHVAATSCLMKDGVVIVQQDAYEKVSTLDAIVFDKTGTLSEKTFNLKNRSSIEKIPDFNLITALSFYSSHVLAKNLSTFHKEAETYVFDNIQETAGQGISALWQGEEIRLGSRQFCAIEKSDDQSPSSSSSGCEIYFVRQGAKPIRLSFEEQIKPEATEVIQLLQKTGLEVHLLSGDNVENVQKMAETCGISHVKAQASPLEKSHYIQALQQKGLKVCMVGDGINDAVALATADISISFSSGTDIARNAADIILQSDNLMRIVRFLNISHIAHRTCMNNLSFSLTYNLFAIPLAMAGFITPLLAALFMSASSLTVMLSALRLLKK